MTSIQVQIIKVADEAWIATALMHREHPEREDFTSQEIKARADHEAVIEERRSGVYVHITQHCVANRPPNPGAYRMLFETRPGHRRLFRRGDASHPARRGKIVPKAGEIPLRYVDLLRWYEVWSQRAINRAVDPLTALYGSGKEMWANDPADQYVARLRQGWE